MMKATQALSLHFISALLFFASFGESSSFTPNCTLPIESTNYVAGPNIRSTLTIIWNCVSIIILCTWNIQHLNVPPIRQAEGFRKLWIAVQASTTKIKWMILTILLPEYFVGKAMNELAAAILMSNPRCLDGEEWGITHCYLANMGYFVLDTQPELGVSTRPTAEDQGENTQVNPRIYHSPYEAAIQRVLEDCNLTTSENINVRRLRYRYWALNSRQWEYVYMEGIASRPNIPSIYLEKLDRGGILVKFLAMSQISYLIIQLIARKIQNLPSSQLEVATLAFSVSSLITYCLYWKHPQGVETIHIIPMAENFVKNGELTELDISRLVSLGPQYMWHKPRTEYSFEPELGPSPIPNDASHIGIYMSPQLNFVIWIFGAVYSGIPFGGLHCLAWNFEFPTTAEGIAWRICSVATACLPLVFMVPMNVWIAIEDLGTARKLVAAGFVLALLLIYILARLFLIVEMIRSLFFLPPEAFIDTWSNGFPHWG